VILSEDGVLNGEMENYRERRGGEKGGEGKRGER
jgi:hypothetical protein